MKLALAFAISSVAAQEAFGDIFEGSGSLTVEDEQFLASCALVCSDGACITAEQKCDGKRHCVDGADEVNCQVEDDGQNEQNRSRLAFSRGPPGQNWSSWTAPVSRGPPSRGPATWNARAPPGMSAQELANSSFSKMRGRLPGAVSAESQFKDFDQDKFERFERRNRKMTEFLLNGENNKRYNLMAKMLFYMSGSKELLSEYFSYGCHCNLSGQGHGKAVDSIDSACSKNNGCRKCAQMDDCSLDAGYTVKAWRQDPDGIMCSDQPGSCGHSLCSCDLQLIRDIIRESREWNRSNHGYHGFDAEANCASMEQSGASSIAGRGLLGGQSGTEKTEMCCGSYPSRFPFTTGQGRACCNNKTYSTHHMECCSDNELRPIGSC